MESLLDLWTHLVRAAEQGPAFCVAATLRALRLARDDLLAPAVLIEGNAQALRARARRARVLRLGARRALLDRVLAQSEAGLKEYLLSTSYILVSAKNSNNAQVPSSIARINQGINSSSQKYLP